MLRRAFLCNALKLILLAALAVGAPAHATAQVYEEPALNFILRTPPGFSATKSDEGGVTTWKLRNNKEAATIGADELVAVTVSALARTPGRDPEVEFRDYVQSFATEVLHGGTVEDFHAAQFAGRTGFTALARGKFDMGAGPRPAVARVLLMEVHDTHVLVSAIAHGQGDQTFASVGAPNSVFAPAETLATPSPSASSSDEKPSTPTPAPPAAGANWAIVALLGILAAVGLALILRRALKPRGPARVERIDTAPAPAPTMAPLPGLAEPAPELAGFCTECGARLTRGGQCPSCGLSN